MEKGELFGLREVGGHGTSFNAKTRRHEEHHGVFNSIRLSKASAQGSPRNGGDLVIANDPHRATRGTPAHVSTSRPAVSARPQRSLRLSSSTSADSGKATKLRQGTGVRNAGTHPLSKDVPTMSLSIAL
jgi:hypothetical protein